MRRTNSSFRHTRYECQRPTVRGFTLVELLVTIAVLAIVMAVAIPNFREIQLRSRLTAAANELVATLQIARLEAVRRRARVVLCPSTNGTSCGGTDWTRVIAFADSNRDGSVTGAEEVIRDTAVNGNGLRLQASTKLASNQRMWFGPDGLVQVGNPAGRAGSVSVCAAASKSDTNTRDVSIAVSRISVTSRNGTAACNTLND